MKSTAKVVAAAILLAAAVQIIGPSKIGDSLHRVGAGPAAVVCVLLFLDTFVTMIRWVWLVRPVSNLHTLEHARIYLQATFFNSFTPGSVGGDGYRVVRLRRSAGGAAPVIERVLQERLVGASAYLIAYLGVFVVAVAVGTRMPVIMTIAAIAVSLALLAITRLRAVVAWVGARRFARGTALGTAVTTVERSLEVGTRKRFMSLVCFSLLAWLAWAGAVAFMARDLGLRTSLPMLAAVATLVELIRFVPISFQGIGVREGTFAVLVGAVGGTSTLGFTLGLTVYLLLSLTQLATLPLAGLVAAIERRVATAGSRREEASLIGSAGDRPSREIAPLP